MTNYIFKRLMLLTILFLSVTGCQTGPGIQPNAFTIERNNDKFNQISSCSMKNNVVNTDDNYKFSMNLVHAKSTTNKTNADNFLEIIVPDSFVTNINLRNNMIIYLDGNPHRLKLELFTSGNTIFISNRGLSFRVRYANLSSKQLLKFTRAKNISYEIQAEYDSPWTPGKKKKIIAGTLNAKNMRHIQQFKQQCL